MHIEELERPVPGPGEVLLDMASIGAGRLSIETKPELVDEVLREAFDLHQPPADEKDITLVQRCAAADVFIEGDRFTIPIATDGGRSRSSTMPPEPRRRPPS